MTTPMRVVTAFGRSVPVTISHPTPADVDGCRSLERAAGRPEPDSCYQHGLWLRDFAPTCVVARRADAVVGVVVGYRRPDQPRTLVVRELVVDRGARGRGLGSAMLDALVDVVPDLDHVETVITPDDRRAAALYTGLARRWHAPIRRSELPHRSPGILCRVGPVRR